MQLEQPINLSGSIDGIRYKSEDEGFAILWLKVDTDQVAPFCDEDHRIIIIGALGKIGVGQRLSVTGTLVKDKKYGMQVKVDSAVMLEPKALTDIVAYITHNVKHVGPYYAEKIGEKFGLDTFKVLDETPDRLYEIEGIGKVRAEGMKKAWIELRHIRELLVFCTKVGISHSFVAKILKKYEGHAIKLIEEDPYRLARDIFGIGFNKADEIALRMGVPELSERRIRAACLFLVEQHADQRGDCFVYRTDLINETVEFLENPSIGPQEVDMIITRAAEADILVDDNGRIYQKRLYQQETELARMLSTMLSQPLPNELAGPAVDKAIMSALGSVGMELHATQVEAIDRTLRSKISIITGGPGTGKTTITKAVVAGYQSAGVPITLLAPTGSASRRMTKVIGVPASTVHRKLFALDKLRKKNNLTLEEVQIHGVVIVDEGSMADLFIAHWIATYLAPEAVLVIVGDEDQLPSVGPGSILRDLIACGRVAVTKLTHIFRQAAGSDIIRHAHAINKGIVPPIARINREHVLARGWPQSDFVMMEVVDQDKQAKAAVWAATTLARSMGFDPKTDVQVLTPMRKGDAGVANLNKVLQEAINPNPPESIDRPDGTHWGTGDRLMQLCNHYPGKDDSNPYYLFNGEQGLLTSFVREEDAKRSVEGINTNFDDDEILIERADFNELTLANAMTVHKSQGSEYAMVIIVLHTAHYVLLQRNLFYTGVTRGRKFVVLITHPDALSMAVHNNRISKRNTYLQERLNEEEAPGGTEQIHLAA